MPELRWTLLILGALFIAVLAWWELRRQRQAPRPKSSHQNTAAPAPAAGSHTPGAAAPSVEGITDAVRAHREPTITFPELQPEPATELHSPVRREVAHDPPVVELDADDFGELRVQGSAADEFTSSDDAQTAALEVPQPKVISAWSVEAKTAAAKRAEPAGSASPVPEPAAQAPPANSGPAVGYVSDEESHAESYPAGATAAGAPIVDWPGEQNRKIVALRLVSGPTARFLGRNVRMALAAEGFVLGKFDIFHKPGPDARAVLSAASLTKPGTFALNTIDGQRFGGLSLFAVLPGPLSPQQTFEELLVTARNLNDRLQGALQDERGEPLTPMRSASIRDSLVNGNGFASGAEPPEAGSPP